MRPAVYLDNKASLPAVEVHDIRIDRVLPPELQAARALPKQLPKFRFGWGHFPAKPPRRIDDRPLELLMPPSTALRAVPLPVPGRTRDRIPYHPFSLSLTTWPPRVSRTPLTMSSSSGSTTRAASLSQKAERKL
jgi:hypothetical protein